MIDFENKTNDEIWKLVKDARHIMFKLKLEIEHLESVLYYGYPYTASIDDEIIEPKIKYDKFKAAYKELEKEANKAVEYLKSQNYNPRA